jgi:hypothetical protein
MNLANETDLAMDEAVKRHLGRLFDSYFQNQGELHSKLIILTRSVEQLGSDAEAATKALADL